MELTHLCNWNCPYCAIDVHSLPPISEEQARKKIETIQNGRPVTLSGGEPGMLSEETVSWILDRLDDKGCDIFLNTNGLFIRRYRKYLKRFKQIIYHCSEDLLPGDAIEKVDEVDTRYMLVVNDGNIARLKDCLDEHKGIKFDIVQATYDNRTGVGLSPENRNRLVVEFGKSMTRESIIRIFREKDWDRI